jgi:Na+-translocating ferredoxin:NAD+ oxidoreductase RnfE subunit
MDERKEEELKESIETLNDTVERIAIALGMPKTYSKRKMVFRSFLSGIARGMGIAVGFTILSALLVSLLTYLASKNLPVIGSLIADIVRKVQGYIP